MNEWHLFRPIAVEVFGRWGETAEETLKEVSMLAPPVLGVPCQKFRRDWSVQLSLRLQKENAEIVNSKTLSIVGKKINKSRVELVFPLLDILVLTVMTEQFHRSRGTLPWTLFCIL